MRNKAVLFSLLMIGAFAISEINAEKCRATKGYLNTFTKYMHQFHAGRDITWKYTKPGSQEVKLEECKKMCLDEPTCKGYELHLFDGRCSIEAINKWDIPLEPHTSYVYFNRDYDCGCVPCKENSTEDGSSGTDVGSKLTCVSSENGKKTKYECTPSGWESKDTCSETPGYLDTFTEYMHQFHAGRDISWKYTKPGSKEVKLEECKKMCLDEPTCKGYELHLFDGRCSIEAINKWDVPLEPHTSYVYFNRDYDCGCAPCKENSDEDGSSGTDVGSKITCVSSENGKKTKYECTPSGWESKDTCSETPGYLDTFTEYMHQFHAGRDISWKYTKPGSKEVKLEECKKMCLDEPKCKGYELHLYDGRCSIEAINKWGRPLEPHTSYVYFNRDYDCGCAPCKENTTEYSSSGTDVGSIITCVSSENGKKTKYECTPSGWESKDTCSETPGYLDTFTEYMHQFHAGRDITWKYTKPGSKEDKLEECKKMCLDQPKCKGYELHLFDGRCSIEAINKWDRPLEHHASYVYYNRDYDCGCAPCKENTIEDGSSGTEVGSNVACVSSKLGKKTTYECKPTGWEAQS